LVEPILVPTFGFLITPDGRATEEFHTWMDQMTNAVNDIPPLTGTGTPEGSVVASVGRWYVDTSAAAGTGIYFKETGDGDTGWVLRS
jgi:hypothetical protein